MKKNSSNNLKLGFLEIPEDYTQFKEEEKNLILDKMIDLSIELIDKELLLKPEVNRIDYLNFSLDRVLDYYEKKESYELCQVIADLKKRLNEE